jgi:hypothetical protein
MGSSHDSARRSRPNVSGISLYEVRKRLDSLKPRPCSPTIAAVWALHELAIQAT